jgi:dipeptidyl aminopeptidase/acylaminoacyl peptidase
MWGTDEIALVSSWWWQTRGTKTWITSPGDPAAAPELLWDRSWQDRYSDPGEPVMRRDERGQRVLRIDGTTVYLTGSGASEEGDRPFFDTLDLATKETARHFRSEAPYYERPWLPLDDTGRLVLTRREAVEEVPNYFVRNLDTGDMRQLTSFPHPSPQLKGLTKELVKYERADGVPLTATLYLPPGYDAEKDGPLPCLMWAYPTEYKSADDAGQVRDSPYRFDRVGYWSPLLFLTQGYCVLDDPSMPIVGEGDVEPNDTFREQLVASAEAAVEYVVGRGVARRDAIAIGGHSYGAFMTANLLAHSDLFATGIARSGAYNRTLTPFGFQSEERTLWEAPEIYFGMSPFMHAEKVNEPILLIHGDSDNNSGTYPMQSERYYSALKGQGATVRLVMLPHESHGYRARESILHMLWEQEEWLDRYLKKGARTEEPASTG